MLYLCPAGYVADAVVWLLTMLRLHEFPTLKVRTVA
ncbi:hypothetical protein NSE_0018 [Neorickettsia sennetsu str. Miyayama]|uniref:Uncharacterized protein n=1 Tax=Ehrlichia sennetsu (strain ATCC VR-367 / Miyayama) TaxID=222891 RepID=Q2GF35_EHRS3|nr:hypothetical protein NSE_0018 [Neorickettsia sennetsu str. Miyayama]